MLNGLHLVGEAERHAELHLVLVLVIAVTAPLLGLPEHRGGEAALARQLRHIVRDAVLVEELRLLKLARLRFIAEAEGNAGIDHRLPLHHIREILRGNGDVGEHIQIRQPAGAGAGLLFLLRGQLGLIQFAHDLAPLKVEAVFQPVTPDGHIHIAGGILGGAGAQAVQAQRVLIVVAVRIVILAAGVQFAVYQFPVEAAFLLVPVHRTAAAHILHLDGAIQMAGDGDEAAVALAGFVDGVGEDLKHRMLAAVQTVGAENNARALPDTVRALQGRNAVISVFLLLFSHSSSENGQIHPIINMWSLYHTPATSSRVPHSLSAKRPKSAKFEEMLLRKDSHNCVANHGNPCQDRVFHIFHTFFHTVMSTY